MFELILLAFSIMAQSSNVILCKRDFIFLLRVGESIVWSISAWIWEIRWKWGLGSRSAGSPRSLSTSAFSSYSGLLQPVIIGVSCSSFSCNVMFSVPIVFTIFFYTPSSFVLSLFVFFYPRRCHFASWTTCPLAFINLSFGTVHLYVGWVTMLTRFSDIRYCTLRGLVLPFFRYLGLVSHCLIHLLPLAFITILVVRPPWGHEISRLLRHISFKQAPSTGWSTRCHPTSISRGYRGVT